MLIKLIECKPSGKIAYFMGIYNLDVISGQEGWDEEKYYLVWDQLDETGLYWVNENTALVKVRPLNEIPA